MKLLCKKSMPPLTQGKYYTLEKTDLIYKSVSGFELSDNLFFTDNPNSLYIWDYFYTPQEERKIKLQKLNEITL